MLHIDYEIWREHVRPDHPWLKTEATFTGDGDVASVRMEWSHPRRPDLFSMAKTVDFAELAAHDYIDHDTDERWHLDNCLQMLAMRRSLMLNLN